MAQIVVYIPKKKEGIIAASGPSEWCLIAGLGRLKAEHCRGFVVGKVFHPIISGCIHLHLP